MELRLSAPQFHVLSYISRVSAASGLNLYLVGGAVRDLTSGHDHVRNMDFALEGDVQKILRAIEIDHRKTKTVSGPPRQEPAAKLEQAHFDSRRQSASLNFAPGVQANITMTHRETRSRPGRPPEISRAGIFEDLRRRDFSANAMAVSLHPNSRGLLLDPTNGAADIEQREFRALDSHSFLDDPSRIYRLMRLSERLGFKAAQRTQEWFDAALEARAWENMSPEMQGRELRALLQEEHPGRILRIFGQHGVLTGLDQSLTAGKIPFDRLEKIRSVARAVPGVDPFLVQFHGIQEKFPPAHRKRLAHKIMPDAATLRTALSLEADARKLTKALTASKMNAPSAVYKFLDGTPQPLLLYVLTHYPQSKIQTRVKNFLFKFPQIRANLPRAEVEALGVEPGPPTENILNQLFLSILDGKVKTQAQITKALHHWAGLESEPLHKAALPAAPKKKNPGIAGNRLRGVSVLPASPTLTRPSARSAVPPDAGRTKERVRGHNS
ncbi:MAG: hypothetical protein ACRD10_01865 [Terriglobia bacterium]